MFTGDGRRLTGSKGEVYSALLDVEVTTGDLAVGVHLITAVGAVTGFPQPVGDGVPIEAGYLVWVRTGETLTLGVGDITRALILTKKCDITDFTIPFTQAQVNVTTLCDNIMRYEKGKTDMQGNMNGIVTIGSTISEDGFLNQFLDFLKQDGITSIDLYKKTEEILFGYFQINKDSGIGDEITVFMPLNTFSFSLGAAQADAQTFTTDFRIASLEDPLVKPAAYRVVF